MGVTQITVEHTSWSDINYNDVELHRGLTSPPYLSRHFDFYCCYDDQYTYSLKTFLLRLAIASSPDRSFVSRVKNSFVETQPTVNFISKDEIDDCAESILKHIEYESGPVPLERICELQSAVAGLVVRTRVKPSDRDVKAGALGRIRFDSLEISIYDLPDTTEARQRFTLAHELGHYFLDHSKYVSSEYCDIADLKLDVDSPFRTNDLRRMDFQANYFASCLLLPRIPLTRDVLMLADERDVRNRGFGVLYVDEQKCNEAIYNGITSHLKLRYKVSRLALKLRLEALGLLHDARTKNTPLTERQGMNLRTPRNFDLQSLRGLPPQIG